MKEITKSAIENPPNIKPLSFDENGKNPGSVVSMEVNTSTK